jgi:hypothetical protein
MVGTTFTLATGPFGAYGTYSAIWYATNTVGNLDGDYVIFSMPGASTGDYVEGYVHDYSGIGAYDSNAADQGSAATDGVTVQSGTLYASAPGELIFAFVAASAATAGPGFTMLSTLDDNLTEQEIAPTAGAYDPSAIAEQGQWIMLAAAFEPQ